MNIVQNIVDCSGIKLISKDADGKEVGRAFLYIMHNGLHDKPFGFMEDVYVAEEMRGRGLGTSLVKRIIELAREKKCYKLVSTSRHSREKVHKLYLKLGFKDQGKEFRIDF